jgi:N6-L-threonylcarbamoyladenine synthase
MRILAIETSCDETSAAVVEDGRWIRSSVVASQIALHQQYGGVVPELAARGHVTAIMPVVRTALAEAGLTAADADAIAVTTGPGLAGALLVGVNAAKGLAFSTGRPLIGVNHLEGHIAANWLVPAIVPSSHGFGEEAGFQPPGLPAICLLVSGGHSEIILVEEPGRYRHLGRTRDDAAGEAFDKGARLLGLGYPGGPMIQRAAVGGDPLRFDLPRAWLPGTHDLSFSGLKTALLRLIEPFQLPVEPRVPDDAPFPAHRPRAMRDDLPVADLAAGYQAAVVEVLATKAVAAARETGARSLVLAGGVAANAALRERLTEEVDRTWRGGNAPEVRYPPLWMCTDNAAMIGAAAFWRRDEATSEWSDDVRPRWPLEELMPIPSLEVRT